jgi:tRNA(adenine34) deaminase
MAEQESSGYYARFMMQAIEEAKYSLREGNKGFGAVLVRNGILLGRTHDTEITDSDPTAHAEIRLIRNFVRINPRENLTGAVLVTTHEPCPMCTGAIIWARLSKIVYGTSIQFSKKLGRTMIDLSCENIVGKAPWRVDVIGDVLADQCSRLYDSSVRKLVEQLRSGGPEKWKSIGQELADKRVAWFNNNKEKIVEELKGSDDIDKAYHLILTKIGIDEKEAPVVERSENKMIFHSQNSCPALDACHILGLDTRVVCRLHTQGATDALIKQLNPKLEFSRNYSELRPKSDFCEEMIELKV